MARPGHARPAAKETAAKTGREMAFKYNHDQHQEYLFMGERIGLKWVDVFRGDTEFYSAAYWDLLTQMWKHPDPVRKTDALKFMKAIKSAHTAGKYIETAIKRGFVIEDDNPLDARSKLVALSSEMRARLDGFFDAAVSEVRMTNHTMNIKGPSPEDP